MSQAGNKLRDIFIAHSFDLEKVKASSARAISRTMDDLILELVRELYQIDPLGVTRTAYQQERLEKLLSMADQTIRSQFKLIAGNMKSELITLAEIESLFATKAINSVFTVKMADYVTSREVLTRLVDNTLIEGAPSAEWWGKQSQDLQDSFSRAMRTGVARGETLPQMAARLRGTQKPGVLGVTGNIPGVTNEQILGVTYDPGLIKKAKRNAEALVRTSYQAVTSAARSDVYQANSDVVKGYQFLSTLDQRTTPQCLSYNGSTWKLDGTPIPPTKLPLQNPPRHWGCRSIMLPLLKSFEEVLGLPGIEQIPPSTRSSFSKTGLSGQISEDITADKWLQSLNVTERTSILGKKRTEMFDKGLITTKDLVSSTSGATLSLSALGDKVKNNKFYGAV